jgi:dolichyl-phosphate-mannose-protein mannosyltransferase
MSFKRWRPELMGLIVAAAITRFIYLFTPNAVVFDEVYFKAFAAHYLDGLYYFDIHPPLGKLILAGFASLQQLSPQAMLDGTVTTLRILPALAGFLLVPLVWGILRRLGASRPFAFLGAFLVLLDNAILVESRFILMDSMLLLFGLGALYFYLRARDSQGWKYWAWLALSTLSAGASVSIKWTGLASLAIVGLLWLWDQPGRKVSWLRRVGELALFAIIPLLIYSSVFYLHFRLLPSSGEGDAFMTQRFQATLKGSPSYSPGANMSFIDKFAELNKEMFRANQTLTAGHPYGSHWYNWPLQQRPIYYWQGDVLSNNRQGHIYLLGNPVIWWGIWIAIIAGLAYVWITGHKLRPRTVAALSLAGAAYFINLIPFMAVSRIMFLYHYFFCLFFSIIFAIMLWNDIAMQAGQKQLTDRTSRRAYAVVLALVLISFVFFLPISYGIPLTEAGLHARMWLPSWR